MFDVAEFRLYLKHKAKKPQVVERNVKQVNDFFNYSKSMKNTPFLSKEAIQNFALQIESEKKSSKGMLYAMMNYCKFIKEPDFPSFTASLREERTSRSLKVFALKDFLDVDQESINALRKIGITNVNHMLKQARTQDQRTKLSKMAGLSCEN